MIFPADDPAMDEPKPTALFAAIAGAAAANSWTSVNGFAAPRMFSSAPEEYEAARVGAAVADFGPLIRYTVRGKEAAAFLARATSAPVATLESGESARGLMLDDSGAVIDIIEVVRLSEDLYLLTCARRHARRLQLAARGLEAQCEEITGAVAALALIGPGARDAAAAAGLDPASETLALQTKVRGVEASARPIHYGALPGIEIVYPLDEALTLWERLRRTSAPRPIGLDALEILRIEGGAPRPGVDFLGADDVFGEADKRRPDEIGLAHLAPVGRAWFNGRRALRAGARPAHRLGVLAIDTDRCLPGAPVFRRKEKVGHLTSAAWSPRLKRIVAFAEIAANGGPPEFEAGLPDGGRAAAEPLETPESRLYAAYRAAEFPATDSRSPRV